MGEFSLALEAQVQPAGGGGIPLPSNPLARVRPGVSLRRGQGLYIGNMNRLLECKKGHI
jgi:hypothetical protein